MGDALLDTLLWECIITPNKTARRRVSMQLFREPSGLDQRCEMVSQMEKSPSPNRPRRGVWSAKSLTLHSCPFNGIHRVHTRCSQKTNSEGGESLEERLLVAQLHRVKVRICAAQGASRFFKHVAFQGIGTAVRDNSWRLVGQIFSGVHNFIFNLNFVTDMLAVFDFFNLPNLFCHICLLTLYSKFKAKTPVMPVTGVINSYDKPPI